ncbi:hypothetical protein M3689_17210 [Alkalihalophilus marmarensis]|uniref:putative ABC transporter permease subunit n=1 Tax=Alkalihalophilus marmarensis TaxID=521377 RepID=UPI00203E7762|nr:hypothetical protein [Alkalihalophilus marmarensis]MCM3491042.1 hypothetical protein [Alkalihalophilus marmarensis]
MTNQKGIENRGEGMTWNLIRWFWKMNLNSFKKSSDKAKTTLIISGVAIGFAVLFFSGIVFSVASTLPGELLSDILSLSFLSLFAFLILFAVPQVFTKLYGDDDLTLLFTLPLKSTHIYWAKFTQVFLGIPGLILAASLVLLTIFGLGAGATIFYYPFAYFTAILVVLMGLGIAYLLNLLLIQMIPAHRAKELMTVITAFAGVLGYVAFQIPTMMTRGGGGESSMLIPELPQWLPLYWAGESVSHLLLGDVTGETVLFSGLLAGVTFAVLYLSSMLVDKSFRTGWIQMNESRSNRKKKKASSGVFKVRSPIIEVGLKEWRTIKRDMREWTMLIPMTFFMFFPIFSIMIRDGNMEFLQSVPALSWISLQAIALGLFSFMTSTFTSGSVAREGSSIDLLRVLPLKGIEVAVGKLWIHWLILFGFIGILQIISAFIFGWSPFYTAAGWLLIGLTGLGSSAVGLYFGAIGAKFNHKNPQNRLETGTSFILLFVAMGYVLIQVIPFGLTLLPASELVFLLGDESSGFFMMIVQWIIGLKSSMPIIVTLIGLALNLFITAITVWGALTFTAKEIDRGITINFVKE